MKRDTKPKKQDGKRKESLNIPILIAGFLLAVIIAIFLVESAKVFNFNNGDTSRIIQFNEDGYSEGPITVTMSKRLGQRYTWETEAITGDSEGPFVASVVDVNIYNESSDTMKDWKLRFDIPKHCYLGNAISGNVEIHQVGEDASGNGVVQNVNFEKMTPDRMMLDYKLDNGKILVELNKGDYFIFSPGNDISADQIAPTTITSVGEKEKQISLVIYTNANLDPADVLKNASLSFELDRELVKQDFFLYLLIVLVVMIQVFGVIYHYERRRTQIKKAFEQEERIFETTTQAFSRIIDDAGAIRGHSIRTAKAAKAMAEALGYNEKRAQNIYYAAKLHDCGMALVPDEILNKKGQISFEEYEEIKKHPSRSFEALRSITDIPEAATAARYHHERFDGTGYPEGRKGTDIPEVARILAVVDAYDSMANNRLYHDKMTPEEMRKELALGEGTQFDPAMVELFLSLLDSGKIVMEEDNDR